MRQISLGKTNLVFEPPMAVLASGWEELFQAERSQPYFDGILQYLHQEEQAGETIYPPATEIYRVFENLALCDIRVVILGQDPYHGPGQAMGLSFSVPQGIKLPPSLKNIFKEIHGDTGIDQPAHGDLTRWVAQGVFLLNTALTVRAGDAGSHAKIGWHQFTDKVIQYVNKQQDHVVFMLWGAHAWKKEMLIDKSRHLVLTAVHPSPLSAYRGFFGSNHFTKANEYLKENGRDTIIW